MKLKGLRGKVEIELYSKEGILKEFRKEENLTLDPGLGILCDIMGKRVDQPKGFGYCAVGWTATTLHTGQEKLEYEIARTLGVYSRLADTLWRLRTTFGPNTAVGSLKECGLFNTPEFDKGLALCRVTFKPFSKYIGDYLIITWEYSLS